MPTFRKGPRGGVLKVTKKGGTEVFTRATPNDIKNMSTAQKIKFATRTKGQKKGV